MTEREVLEHRHRTPDPLAAEFGQDRHLRVDVPYFHNTPEICQSKALVSGADQCVFNRSR
jgi:hypothetical protein